MKVIPIKPGIVGNDGKEPYIDIDLIERLELLLEAAREGRVKSYADLCIIDGEIDRWWWIETEWEPHICFQAQRLINSFAVSED